MSGEFFFAVGSFALLFLSWTVLPIRAPRK